MHNFQPLTNIVYKGYTIKKTLQIHHFVSTSYAIAKGGYHIAWAESVEDAKKKIDELV